MRRGTIESYAGKVAGALGLLLATSAALASVVDFSGRLNDPANAALVGVAAGPSAPSFIDDFAIANNTAVYSFRSTTAGAVRFTSLGFVAGGVDPYFSLFSGVGPAAIFVASNFAQAFSTGGDFDLTVTLPTGSYVFGIGAFANQSLAENAGSGVLGDGFTGLGQPGALGNYFYQVRVTTPDVGNPGTSVPEPGTILLTIAGLLSALVLTPKRNA